MASLLPLLSLLLSTPSWAQDEDDDEIEIPPDEPRLDDDFAEDDEYEFDDTDSYGDAPLEDLPTGPAYDGPITPVLVSEFQPVTSDAAGFAALLRLFLNDELDRRPELRSIPVEDVPSFGEHSALVYLESCPPGDQIGCAWVVGKRVDAAYALTGEVEARYDGSTRVSVTVIDVAGAREVLSFDVELAIGDDQALADAVTELVVAVASGEVGQEQDIREAGEIDAPRSTAENQMISQELNQLSGELGDVTVTTRADAIERPEYTVDDLADDMASDAIPPWEQLGIPPGEYLRYKNSGLTLVEWRAGALGRKSQLTVRLAGGLMYGAVDTLYEGRYALEVSGTEFVVVEEYAWQTLQNATGGHGGVWLGFGIIPILEVQIGAGLVSGTYTLRVGGEQAGDEPREPQEQTTPQVSPWVGARVLAVPLQWSRVRPIIGGGVRVQRGYGYDRFWDADSLQVDALPAPWLLEIQAVPGVEIGVARGQIRKKESGYGLPPGVDVTITVPIGVIVGGQLKDEYHTDQQVLSPGSYTEPPSFSLFSAGLELGATVRLGGATFQAARSLDEIDDLAGEEDF
jgi:hypothetical protein